MLRVMLREMLRQVLRLILRWLLRSMPTDVLREMPTLVPTVVLRMLPRMVTTVLLPVLRTVHGQGHDREQSTPGSCIRSGRATNGDEAKHRGKGFADRHHPRSSGLPKERGQNRGVEMR